MGLTKWYYWSDLAVKQRGGAEGPRRSPTLRRDVPRAVLMGVNVKIGLIPNGVVS
jgi:hypothetical protein